MAIRKNARRSQETSPKLTFTVNFICTPSEGVGDAQPRYDQESHFDEFTSGCSCFFNRLKDR